MIPASALSWAQAGATTAPVDPFTEWEWTFLAAWPVWLRVLAFGALAGAVWLSWRGLRFERHVSRRRALLSLRAATALGLGLLLLEPGIERRATRPIRSRLALVTDRSASMDLPAQAGEPATRAGRAVDFITDPAARASLSTRFQLDDLAFARKPAATTPEALRRGVQPSAAGGDGPADDPERDGSDLLAALEEAAHAGSGRPLAAIVLTSDGADTGTLAAALDGSESGSKEKGAAIDDLRTRLKSLGAPVVAVDPTGGTVADRAVSNVQAEDFAFVRTPVEVEVEVTHKGLSAGRVPVTLERDGQVLERGMVDVPADGAGRATLRFTPDTTGEFAMRVSVPVEGGELVPSNNARSFVLKVIRDRVRVLHVSGPPTFDTRFLRMFLKTDPNIDLVSFFILRTNDDLPMVVSQDELSLIPFPVDEIFDKQLNSFDVVVMQSIEAEPYGVSRYLGRIAEYVRGGGSLVMLGGPGSFAEGGYAGTPLASILPVELVRGGPGPDLRPFLPRLTDTGRAHPITAVVPGEAALDEAWRTLPPLPGSHRLTPTPGAQVLLTHPDVLDARGTPAPVVVAAEMGRGRTVAVSTDASWLWGTAPIRDGRAVRVYEQFYRNMLRWLSRDPELTSVRLRAERDRYTPADAVTYVVQARRADYGAAEGAAVRLSIQRADLADGQSSPRVVEGRIGIDGTVRLDGGRLSPGAWRAVAHVTAEDGGDLGEASDVLVVESGGREWSRPAPRPDVLQFLASETGGTVVRAADTRLDRLPVQDPGKVEVTRRQVEPLWDRAWVLAALLALWAVEWVLRRRWGWS